MHSIIMYKNITSNVELDVVGPQQQQHQLPHAGVFPAGMQLTYFGGSESGETTVSFLSVAGIFVVPNCAVFRLLELYKILGV